MVPSEGLKPTTPQQAAGMRLEPPPSVPSEIGPMPVATATAEPELDAPGVTFASIGFRVRPNNGDVAACKWPNSGVVVLPTRIAPAAFARDTETASVAGTLVSSRREPMVVRTPAVLSRSLAE